MRLLVVVSWAATLACSGSEIEVPPPLEGGKDLCDSEAVAIRPLGLTFGRLVPGTTSTRTATLTYQGCEPALLEIGTDGNLAESCDRGAFCLTSTPDLVVEPGETIPLELIFRPYTNGVALGGLVVGGCPSTRCRAELWLQGTAQSSGLVCHPNPLDFGAVAPGACTTRQVNCTNIADRVLTIDRVAMDADSSHDLGARVSTPIALQPEQAAAVDVEYCPPEEGPDQGTLIVVSSIEGRTASVAIGLAARSGGGKLDVADAVDFGMVSLIAPARRPMRITNGGAQRLEVFGVETDPPFMPVLQSGASLDPGESAHLWVQVEPTSEGRIQGTVQLFSDDPQQPMRTVQVSVQGLNLPPCELVLEQETLDFGSVAVGEAGTETLDVTNAGTLDCMITAASVVEVGSAFEVPDETSRRIAPGTGASITVRFSPTSTITPSGGTLELGVSSPTEPYRRIPLIGRGH
jgi:hypothetical protein